MTRLLTILWKALTLNKAGRHASTPPADDSRQLWRMIEKHRAQEGQAAASESEPVEEPSALPPSLRSYLAEHGEPRRSLSQKIVRSAQQAPRVEGVTGPVGEPAVLPPSLREHLSQHSEGRRHLWQVIGERRALRAEQNTAKPEPVVRPVRAERSHHRHAPARLFRLGGVSGRRAFLAMGVIVVLVFAAGATAYLTLTGSGFGSGLAGSTQSVTISPGTPTSELYPGGTADVAVTIDNPNTFKVHLPSLALDTSQGTSGFSVDAGNSTCNLGSLSFTTQTNGGGDFIVPAKVGVTDGTLTVDLTGAIKMDTTAVSACQGATFTVYLKVGP